MKKTARRPSISHLAWRPEATADDTGDHELAIGVDLGATNLKVALVDYRGEICGRREAPTRPERGPDSVIADIAGLAEQLIVGVGAASSDISRRAQIVGLGIGSPGPLDLVNGRILRAANLPGWVDVPMRDALATRLGVPVVLDNDANAAALGEYWASDLRGDMQSDLVLLTLGTGIGAGAIIDGRLFHGHFGNAAEIGHTIVVLDGRPCPCRQRGCLEAYSSAISVVRRTIELIRNGEACALGHRIKAGEAIEASDVAAAAGKGDSVCERVWDDACRFLATACVNIQHMFNPATIVFAGGMAQAGEMLLGRVQSHFGRLIGSIHTGRPTLRLSSLGLDAGVIGAARMVWEKANER